MKKIAKIVRVEPIGPHILSVWFEDGGVGMWRSTICTRTGPMALPLHDPAFFARVSIEDGALVWPNGWDASANYIYEEMRLAGAFSASTVAAE